MTKIIPVRQSDIKKIVKMIEYVTQGMSPGMIGDKTFIHFPFNIIHNLFPVNLKFLQECYVAVEKDESLGLISLTPDGHTKTRWKINRLILGTNAYDTGKQLVDYVVNKYGGAGVETFITVIDENYAEAISLFKNSCFFRYCSKINVWEYDSAYSSNINDKPNFLRKADKNDAQKLFELDSEAILPHLRPSLAKNFKDFNFNLINKTANKLKGYKTSKYVLDNPANNRIEGFLSILTVDNNNFWIDITLSLAYQEYYEDFINFAVNTVKSQNKNAKLYVGTKDYLQTGKFMKEVLSNHKFGLSGTFQVLVKDYWKPAGLYKEQKVPAIIFPDMTSPACNIIKFISES